MATRILDVLESREMHLVPRANGMPNGACYWNVADLIEQFGGDAIIGWAVVEMPGLYIEASHHTIWRLPNNTFVDPTASGLGEGRTCFVPDGREKVVLDKPVMIPNRYVALSDSPLVRRYMEVTIAHSMATQQLMDLATFPPRWRPGMEISFPHQIQVHVLNDQVQKLVEEHKFLKNALQAL